MMAALPCAQWMALVIVTVIEPARSRGLPCAAAEAHNKLTRFTVCPFDGTRKTPQLCHVPLWWHKTNSTTSPCALTRAHEKLPSFVVCRRPSARQTMCHISFSGYFAEFPTRGTQQSDLKLPETSLCQVQQSAKSHENCIFVCFFTYMMLHSNKAITCITYITVTTTCIKYSTKHTASIKYSTKRTTSIKQSTTTSCMYHKCSSV